MAKEVTGGVRFPNFSVVKRTCMSEHGGARPKTKILNKNKQKEESAKSSATMLCPTEVRPDGGKKNFEEVIKGTNDKGDKDIERTKDTGNNFSKLSSGEKLCKDKLSTVASDEGSTKTNKTSKEMFTILMNDSDDDKINTLLQNKLEKRRQNGKQKHDGIIESVAIDALQKVAKILIGKSKLILSGESLKDILMDTQDILKDTLDFKLWQVMGKQLKKNVKYHETLKAFYNDMIQNKTVVDSNSILTALINIQEIPASHDNINNRIIIGDLEHTNERDTPVGRDIEQTIKNEKEEQDPLHYSSSVFSNLENNRQRGSLVQDMIKRLTLDCHGKVHNIADLSDDSVMDVDKRFDILASSIKDNTFILGPIKKVETVFPNHPFGLNNRMTHQDNISDKSHIFFLNHENKMTKQNEAFMNRKNQKMNKRNSFYPGLIFNDEFDKTFEDPIHVIDENTKRHLLDNIDISVLWPHDGNDHQLIEKTIHNNPEPLASEVNDWDINDHNLDVSKSGLLPAHPKVLEYENEMGTSTVGILEVLEPAKKQLPPYQDFHKTRFDDIPEFHACHHLPEITFSDVPENLESSDAEPDANNEDEPEMVMFDCNGEETSHREPIQDKRNVLADGSGITSESGDAEIGTYDAEENIEAECVDIEGDDTNMVRENSVFERENGNAREEDIDVDPGRENTDTERSREESVENTDVERENLEDSTRGDTDAGGENVDVEGSSTDAQRENMESIGNIGTEGEEDNAVEFGMATAVDEAREDRGGDGEDEVNADDETDRQVAVLPEDSEAHLSFLDHPFGDEDPDPMESFMFSFPGLEGGLTSGLTSLEALMADSTLRLDVMLENVIHQMLAMQPDLLHDEAAPPATEMVIDRVPEVTITAELLEQHPSCPICLCENQMHDTMSQLPCQHVFHPVCLRGWLVKSGTCPVCRSRL